MSRPDLRLTCLLLATCALAAVQGQGSDAVGGVPAKKYLVHHEQPHPGDVTMWINHEDLPIQIQIHNLVKGNSMTSTIR